MEDMVETDDSRSEWARVYLTVVISSSSGVRKDTRFVAGNMGREGAILRGESNLAGLLVRMDVKWWGCLYGMEMVADSLDAEVSVEDRVDAESGVLAQFALEKLLSMESCGLAGRWRAGAVEGCSWALEKVLRTVGETALRTSRRRLVAFPRMRGCWVLMDSLGRWESGRCIIGSEAAMVGG